MKGKKVLWRVLVSLAALLLMGGAGFLWWANDVPDLEAEAQAALGSDAQVQVQADPWLVFSPVEVTPTVGFIFYPGGKVPAEAYAVLARGIAESGYLVVVPRMPLYLAVFDSDAAAEIIPAFPGIQKWVIGGHSLGGSMATLYLDGHLDQLAGLVLLASYPAESNDLSAKNVRVLSIFASEDGLATREKIDASRSLLPADTTFLEIAGGNHAGFGYYGPQAGDGTASIPKAEQHQLTTNAIVTFLNQFMEETP